MTKIIISLKEKLTVEQFLNYFEIFFIYHKFNFRGLIFKKGDLSKIENYRGISLLCVAYKILAKMIAKKLNEEADKFLLECQNGFRKGRSCTDASYSVKSMIEKRVELNEETHICFIDFEKT